MKNNCFSRKSDCLFDLYFLIVSASGNQRLQHIQSDFGRHLGRCMTFTSTSGNLIRPWMMVRLQKDKRSWWFKAYFPNGKPTTWASSLGICWIFIHFLLGFLSKSESWSSLRVPFSVFCWWMLRIQWVNLFYQDFSNYPSWQHAASSVHVLVFFDIQTYSPSNFWG
jgi:hypothetical protein